MKVSIGGFYQGICDSEQAEKVMAEYNDAKIIGTCVCCGNKQEIKSAGDQCKNCKIMGNWK